MSRTAEAGIPFVGPARCVLCKEKAIAQHLPQKPAAIWLKEVWL